MVTGDDDASNTARPPTIDDLLRLCRELNACSAKYLVIGGMAIIQHGFVRGTEDIDLLIDSSPENFEKVRAAMLTLPDGAVRDVEPGDLDKYIVVRVGDEFVIDLMRLACGIAYAEASEDAVIVTIRGVAIPFASPRMLLRLKQTYREKDALDRAFLTRLLKN